MSPKPFQRQERRNFVVPGALSPLPRRSFFNQWHFTLFFARRADALGIKKRVSAFTGGRSH